MLASPRGASFKEAIPRRLQWSPPEGVRPVAEYWLMTPKPTTIAIFEADDVGPIMAIAADWDDLYAITVVPAVTAEQGMEMAKKMMG